MRLTHLLKLAATSLAIGMSAHAGPDAYLGDVILTANTYCPRNTIPAQGQLLSVADYSALFSLYGTAYGGDGRTSFGVPDMRGRAPVHIGQGPGLTNYQRGQRFGVEGNQLTTSQMASHSHDLMATTSTANTNSPNQAYLAGATTPPRAAGNASVSSGYEFSDDQLSSTGSSNPSPINNVQPILAMTYCVYATGWPYPPRS